MDKLVQHWTQIFIDRGFEIVEARNKAEAKVAFHKECDELKPEDNKPTKGL